MTTTAEVNWLNATEMRAWRAYVLSKPMLEHQLHRELSESHGISLVDYELLVRLSEGAQGRLRMSQLASDLGVSKSKVSHQIARMEQAGTVRRAQCAEDARGVHAEITEYGRQILAEAAPTHVAGVRAHIVDLLTPDEQHVLAAVFDRIIEHLRTLAE